ncbi:GntR family transcriptional regulator [Neobacillus sp. PS3-12]|jgi:GntR family transcriptional regulator, rspAB operon transcriptional repressor|uniref:GntR family transcriptional regulator n=1 Tax=Neobacillus sp. PS3-12 TaxID=3070677 RepID=UPI0027DF45DD|nr:GntR family transcriptional regulator [Neobacillus sp. PS3-12]WML51260.1 GntR family transcriptional regulator [Neobacillus sp. PS3-12]
MAINRGVNAKEFAYNEIKEQILTLKLIPGTKLSEKSMSDQLQISRTPIREAFLKLAQEELLEIIPQSGTFVSLINSDYAEEARFVREKLETAVILLACDIGTRESLFNLEANLKIQELLACDKNGIAQKGNFFDLDEKFHKEFFEMTGKRRTWQMMQNINGHLNRYRILRLKSTESFDWDILIDQHKSIFTAIQEKDKLKAEKNIIEHLQLMLSEESILIKQYPDYFESKNKYVFQK